MSSGESSYPESRGIPRRSAHGTRSRYVQGCRCEQCVVANSAAARERTRRLREAAAEVVPTGPPIQSEMVRAGHRYRVLRCPGAEGRPCVATPPRWLKEQGLRVCMACVDRALVWNGLVDAAPLREHLLNLSAAGVGYKAVADAATVSRTVLQDVMMGRKTRVRAQTARKALAVDRGAMADHGLVDAATTWELLERLIEQGYSRARLAHELGHVRGALQIGRERCLARTALAVSRLYLRLCSVPRRTVGRARSKLKALRVEMYGDDRLRAELGDCADEVFALEHGSEVLTRGAAEKLDSVYLRLTK